MSRSVWKGPFVASCLIAKVSAKKASGKIHEAIRTWSRCSTIIPAFIDVLFEVHNGKSFVPIRVSSDMVGRKLGEFAPTRTFRGHSGDKKVKRS